MAKIKVRAIILKAMDYKEKDRLIHVFAQEHGKLSVLAKHVRGKNRTGALLEPMNLVDFVLTPGQSFYFFDEASCLAAFSHVKSDYDRIAYGSYFLELVDIACQDREANDPLFLDLVKALTLLDQAGVDPIPLVRSFELKCLVRTGNFPDPALGKTMSRASRQLVWFMMNKPLEEGAVLSGEAGDWEAVARLTDYLLKESFQRRPKSLDILKVSE